MTKKKNKQPNIPAPFAWRTIEMLRSPAMSVLSLTGRRILDRIEIELAGHGGNDNGSLPVTYADFQRFGIDGHAIGPGLRELEALGFIEITERGRAGNADHRRPNMIRLTYRFKGDTPPTNEWRRITTIKEAKQIAAKVRPNTSGKRKRRKDFRWGKNPKPMGETPSEKPEISMGDSNTEGQNSRWGKPPLLSRYLSICGDYQGREGAEPVPSPAVVPAPRRRVPEVEVYLQRWLTDCCVEDPAATTRSSELLPACRAWAKCNGRMNGVPILEQDLIKVLTAKGYRNHKSMLGVVFSGIRLGQLSPSALPPSS